MNASGQTVSGRREQRAARPGSLTRRLLKCYPLYFMLLPAVALLLIFHYMPMYGAQIAFRDFKPSLGITGSPWAGMKHFADFFNSYQFQRVLVNTITLSLYGLAASFPVTVLMALSLNCVRSEGFKKTVQTVTYMPHFISTVVIVGIVLRFFNPHIGIVSRAIQLLGGTARDLMGIPAAVPHVYVWSGIWQNAGWGTIIYLAALASVDPSQHEAAVIDGATRLQRVFYVDFPAIVPTIMITLIMNMGHIMSVGFEKIFLMQNTMNLSTTEVISTYVYKVGIAAGRPNYSQASAIGLFNSGVNFALTLIVNTIAKMLKQTTLW